MSRWIAALACIALLALAPAAWAVPGTGPLDGSGSDGPSWVDRMLEAFDRLWPYPGPEPDASRALAGDASSGADDSGVTTQGGALCKPTTTEAGCGIDPDG